MAGEQRTSRTNSAILVLLLLLVSKDFFVFFFSGDTTKEAYSVISNMKETVPDHGEKSDGSDGFRGETEMMAHSPGRDGNLADVPMKSSRFLDFYIMGFPKCATSSLMKLFGEIVNETAIIKMDNGTPEYSLNEMEDVERLLEKIEEGRNTNSGEKKYGIKWPAGLHKDGNLVRSMKNLLELNPQHEETKLIIGMRHPVRHFESFWNYREVVHRDMPPPSTLIGASDVGVRGVYTGIGRFETHLVQLGKFGLEKEDYAWLEENDKAVVPTKNEVFLYLQDQFQDENTTRFQKFLDDLLSFVGVGGAKVTPDDFPHANVMKKEKPFDICDEEHAAIRDVLLSGGKATAQWFRRNLENSRDIYVSDKEYFLSTVNTWGQDPCVSGEE